ncbi:hypothetical protein COU53_03340 [Candidatus Pacearchaeota archaeon CG10_big_fil_rev_8_21_14_0_10_30_48]|nr:MAG: hypothetical protein COU53_03340 [Candidatus Pacearchaeota archaeon CG10_big_fil_rev_8_21_14_0_10_30_48]
MSGEKVLSLWMFLVWGLIALAIVLAVFIFYGQEADIKILQSDILIDRLADCFIDQGQFVDVGNVFEDCNLNKEIFDKGNFYFKVSFLEDSISGGNKDFEIQCGLRKTQDEKSSENFARCSQRSFIALKDNQEINVEIFAGSNVRGGKF